VGFGTRHGDQGIVDVKGSWDTSALTGVARMGTGPNVAVNNPHLVRDDKLYAGCHIVCRNYNLQATCQKDLHSLVNSLTPPCAKRKQNKIPDQKQHRWYSARQRRPGQVSVAVPHVLAVAEPACRDQLVTTALQRKLLPSGCNFWLFHYIWLFDLFKILIQICKSISYISAFFSNKINHIKIYYFDKNNLN
jgi:hypothetical protein